jgi:hypothetical protein
MSKLPVLVPALVLVAQSAVAVVLVTPPLKSDVANGRDTYTCSLLSTKPTPVENVSIELVRETGAVVASLGPFTVFPNDDRTIIWESGIQVAYCRAIGPLSKAKTLLTLCSSESPLDSCSTSVSIP